MTSDMAHDNMTPEESGDAREGEDHLSTIAEASAALGVTQRTLRFYEDKGLIHPRRVGAMRVYSKREMGRMRLILRGKRLGFSIREIAEHLTLYDSDPDPAHVSQTERLLDRVVERLEELRAQRVAIEQTIDELELIEQQAREYIAERKSRSQNA